MAGRGAVVVVGGTRAIGLEVVKHYAARGDEVVLTGQGGAERRPRGRGGARDARDRVRPCGAARDRPRPRRRRRASHAWCSSRSTATTNTIRDYDIDKALRLVTLKLVGFTTVVHALLDRLDPATSSIVLFGGMAKERPYPGSTTVTTVNGGVVGRDSNAGRRSSRRCG